MRISGGYLNPDIRTSSRDKAQPVRQRRVVDESVGDHGYDYFNS